jgi:transposase
MRKNFPEWVLKHKKKGVAIEKRGNKYYASLVTSKWDPIKKRPQKKTLEYLGVITPDGIIPSKSKQPIKLGGCLDAGNIRLAYYFSKNIEEKLKEVFPRDWQSLMAMACIKLCYLEKFTRFKFRYETSVAKHFWPNASLSKNSLTKILENVGGQWELQKKFFSEISKNEKHMAIDLSQLFSYSKNISLLEYGYNHQELELPQISLLLLWGISNKRPGFLKVFSGAMSSAQTISEVIKEAKLQNVIAVVDKGFWSSKNKAYFDQENLQYIMALKRDLSFVEHKNINKYENHFQYKKHLQWWRKTEFDKSTIYHILDKRLAIEEEETFLNKIKKGEATKKEFNKKKARFGTISLITNTGLSAEETYKMYKERQSIEVAFDTLKNTLCADKTWMQNEKSLKGYLFISFLALHLHSQILDHLKRKKIENMSVNDVLTYLTKIQLTEINGKNYDSPFTKQTKKIIDALELPITN